MVGILRVDVIGINNYMSNNTSYPCSCIFCKELKTSKGIHSHYLISHTTKGKQANTKKLKNAGLLATATHKAKAASIQKIYLRAPTKCTHCNKALSYKQRHNTFCNTSCSASYYNADRIGTSIDIAIKHKISIGVKKANLIISSRKIQYSKVSFCTICGSAIPHRLVKTCSPNCKAKLLSNNIIERIKLNRRSNYRRDKKSYLELSFESWLTTNHPLIKYEDEYFIKNHITNKAYFVDFYFSKLNLIVELDGKQHEKPIHKEADIVRDAYIQEHLNITVFRISYDEYQSGTKLIQLSELFQ